MLWFSKLFIFIFGFSRYLDVCHCSQYVHVTFKLYFEVWSTAQIYLSLKLSRRKLVDFVRKLLNKAFQQKESMKFLFLTTVDSILGTYQFFMGTNLVTQTWCTQCECDNTNGYQMWSFLQAETLKGLRACIKIDELELARKSLELDGSWIEVTSVKSSRVVEKRSSSIMASNWWAWGYAQWTQQDESRAERQRPVQYLQASKNGCCCCWLGWYPISESGTGSHLSLIQIPESNSEIWAIFCNINHRILFNGFFCMA